MHTDNQPKATTAKRRVRGSLAAAAVVAGAGMALFAPSPAQADEGNEEGGDFPVAPAPTYPLYPDPWDGCAVSWGEEVPDDPQCPPDAGGTLYCEFVDDEGLVWIAIASGGSGGTTPCQLGGGGLISIRFPVGSPTEIGGLTDAT